jgi:DNA polymerase elongation subunit (family B)
MIRVQCLNNQCDTNYFRIPETRTSARILHFDIETAPMEVYTFSNHPDFIPHTMLKRDWYVICWSANWDDSDKVISDVQTPEEAKNSNDGSNRVDDRRIVERLWGLLDSADIVVTKNGKKFDIPKMNERFVVYGLPPTTQYRQVDNQEILKGLGFSWKGLDPVRKRMGGDGKIPTDITWWLECMKGNPAYLKKMSEYCGHDVLENKILYHDIRAWYNQHPNMGMYAQTDEPVCTVCGSSNLEEITTTYKTQVNEYPQFRCLDCGHTPRGRKTIRKSTVQLVG